MSYYIFQNVKKKMEFDESNSIFKIYFLIEFKNSIIECLILLLGKIK